MAIVNFAIPKTLDKRVKEVMEEKGFASKAEFFRSAAIHYIEDIHLKFKNEDDQIEFLVSAIQQKLERIPKGKKLPSLKEQLEAYK